MKPFGDTLFENETFENNPMTGRNASWRRK